VEGGEQAPGCLDLLLLPKKDSFINSQSWSPLNKFWHDNHVSRAADPVHLRKFGTEVDYFMFLGLLYPVPEVRIQILPFSHKGVEQTEIMLAKIRFTTKFFKKFQFLRQKIMCLWASYKKKI
jgi:hypothetical protein